MGDHDSSGSVAPSVSPTEPKSADHLQYWKSALLEPNILNRVPGTYLGGSEDAKAHIPSDLRKDFFTKTKSSVKRGYVKPVRIALYLFARDCVDEKHTMDYKVLGEACGVKSARTNFYRQSPKLTKDLKWMKQVGSNCYLTEAGKKACEAIVRAMPSVDAFRESGAFPRVQTRKSAATTTLDSKIDKFVREMKTKLQSMNLPAPVKIQEHEFLHWPEDSAHQAAIRKLLTEGTLDKLLVHLKGAQQQGWNLLATKTLSAREQLALYALKKQPQFLLNYELPSAIQFDDAAVLDKYCDKKNSEEYFVRHHPIYNEAWLGAFGTPHAREMRPGLMALADKRGPRNRLDATRQKKNFEAIHNGIMASTLVHIKAEEEKTKDIKAGTEKKKQ